MKRVLSVFCAMVLCISLCACGSDSVTSDTSDSVEDVPEATTEGQDNLEEKDEPAGELEENVDESETDDEMEHFSDAVDQLIDAVKNEDENIMGVKLGTTSDYPGVTYGEAFEEFFAKPKWEYFKGTQEGPDDNGDGQPDYVNEDIDVVEFTGYCTYQEVEVKALIQFTLDNEAGTFEATYLSFNEVPQSTVMLYGLLSKVFESYIEEHDIKITDEITGVQGASYPDGMNYSAETIDALDIAGYYGGDYGQSVADISIYSSPEDAEVGNANIYLDSEIEVYGGNEYVGCLVEVDKNLYQLQTDGDQTILIGVNYDAGGDYISFELWIDNQYVETYYMMEHYVS